MVGPSHEVMNTDSPRKAHSMGGTSRWHGGQGEGHIFLSFEESSRKRDVNSHLLNVYFVLNTLVGHIFLFLLLGFYFLPSTPFDFFLLSLLLRIPLKSLQSSLSFYPFPSTVFSPSPLSSFSSPNFINSYNVDFQSLLGLGSHHSVLTAGKKLNQLKNQQLLDSSER